MNKNNKRKRAFANKLHKEIFWLVFIAALVPAAIVMVLLYYLIFNITAEQMVIPEAIAYNLIPAAKKVIVILLFSAPICTAAILFFAYKISHRIIGPFDRIVRELRECTEGKKKDHIVIRKNDKFTPLVDKINKLLDKL
ncbi:MAG: hypothetical protein KKC66_01975 [Candidatus Omnitrophica bacterium]|nr:hypothetical protein [Candidatus Omnitrophota bacterium]MBU1932653.1 hypothetical protein [Candidatus Omnitrophota bacterium]